MGYDSALRRVMKNHLINFPSKIMIAKCKNLNLTDHDICKPGFGRGGRMESHKSLYSEILNSIPSNSYKPSLNIATQNLLNLKRV